MSSERCNRIEVMLAAAAFVRCAGFERLTISQLAIASALTGGRRMARLLGNLVSLEITSPDVEESAEFYERKFGMRVVERTDQKVYLRCWATTSGTAL